MKPRGLPVRLLCRAERIAYRNGEALFGSKLEPRKP
jgi:hypothetical protein